MKKVININFQGRVVPIEETSFELLKNYTDSLRIYFANEEGRDEIINDIESRIGELFQERLQKGSICITDEDVNAIINSMGRPEDLDDAENAQESTSRKESSESKYQPNFTTPGGHKRLYRDENNKVLGGVCSGIAAYFNIEPIIVRLVFIFSGIGFFAYILLWILLPASSVVQNGVRKRLYRNPDDKIIAGVCSGIASYFNINVWIPRVLFLVPFLSFFFRWGHFGPLNFPNFVGFSFSPGTLLIYIILWLVIPEASTTSEKLEMKGEKVDMNSIKNSVMEEMKGVQERMTKFGKEASEIAKQKGFAVGAETAQAFRKTRSGLGDVIAFIAKAFAYVVVAIVGLALVTALFALAIVSIGLFPLKNYILTDGGQTLFAWGTLILFVGVPVIGIITWIIRRLARIKSSNNMMRYSFLALWLLGIFCFISLIVSVGQDFRSSNTVVEENVPLVNPGVNKMEVTSSSTARFITNTGWFKLEPFANLDEDTAYVNNVRLRLVKSANDSFRVTMVRLCNGETRRYADTLANHMRFNVTQLDSTLVLDKGIAITQKDKFRNQRVIVTIAVPVGKIIRVNRNTNWHNWVRFEGPWQNRDFDYDWDQEEHGWSNHYDEDLIMKADGLYTMDGNPVNGEDWNNRHPRKPARIKDIRPNSKVTDGYRYDETQKKIDSLQDLKEKQKQKLIDSLDQMEEQIRIRKEKINSEPEAAPTKKAEAITNINFPVYNTLIAG